jgi:hypothetical protein
VAGRKNNNSAACGVCGNREVRILAYGIGNRENRPDSYLGSKDIKKQFSMV